MPDPSIHQFHVIMDAWAQKNRQMSDYEKKPATAMKVGDKGVKKREPNQKRPPLSEEEKSRRRNIKGRCFRCGLQDHMVCPPANCLQISPAILARIRGISLLPAGAQGLGLFKEIQIRSRTSLTLWITSLQLRHHMSVRLSVQVAITDLLPSCRCD